MRILIDMDGVMADTVEHWLSRYNEEYDDRLTHNDITQWEIHKFVKPECGLSMYKIMEREGFFLDLKPMPHLSESMRELQDMGHDLVVVTATPTNSRTGLYDKVKWLKTNLPWFDANNFVSTSLKGVVDGDLLIDDGPHNIAGFPGATCVYDQPWNQLVAANHRVSGWRDIVALIDRLHNGGSSNE